MAATKASHVVETLGRFRQFGGWWTRYRHPSWACGTPMTFSVFLPDDAPAKGVPALWTLAGLTCTDENFPQKAGAARRAAARKIALVAPDTSPRGAGLPGEDDAYDFGSGAGFYLDATEAPWSTHYNMETYITAELPEVLETAVPEIIAGGRAGITGHSMGGHGALTLAWKHPDRYASVSAFAPICHPTAVPWGATAFEGYLGSVDAGRAHDAAELVRAGAQTTAFDTVLVDVGADDAFLVGDVDQLRPDALREACEAAGQSLDLRVHPGYDHSYFFVSTFVDDHVDFHADRLLRP